jgi:hypothetical protein
MFVSRYISRTRRVGKFGGQDVQAKRAKEEKKKSRKIGAAGGNL